MNNLENEYETIIQKSFYRSFKIIELIRNDEEKRLLLNNIQDINELSREILRLFNKRTPTIDELSITFFTLDDLIRQLTRDLSSFNERIKEQTTLNVKEVSNLSFFFQDYYITYYNVFTILLYNDKNIRYQKRIEILSLFQKSDYFPLKNIHFMIFLNLTQFQELVKYFIPIIRSIDLTMLNNCQMVSCGFENLTGQELNYKF